MNLFSKKAAVLAAGFVLGGAAYAAISNGRGRKACVSLTQKALKLKDAVTCSVESMKENVADIVAEARFMDEGAEPTQSSGRGAEEGKA